MPNTNDLPPSGVTEEHTPFWTIIRGQMNVVLVIRSITVSTEHIRGNMLSFAFYVLWANIYEAEAASRDAMRGPSQLAKGGTYEYYSEALRAARKLVGWDWEPHPREKDAAK